MKNDILTPLTECLCCQGELIEVFDFGPARLANTYGVEEKFPLVTKVCGACFHMQLGHAVSPDVLFSDYSYCSGTSESARTFFTEFAKFATNYAPRSKAVLDIACNDGTQLDAFAALGLKTFGCDPANNLAPGNAIKGHEVFVGLFEDMKFEDGEAFDIITAQNVLAHTARPVEFLQKAKTVMHEVTRLFITTSHSDMIPRGECDSVYHEHISYFNALSMMRLVERAGLVLLDIINHPFQGNSYVFVVGREGEPFDSVWTTIGWETHCGQYHPSLFKWWATSCRERIDALKRTVHDHRRAGLKVFGLCAAAKGISMLNMAGITLDALFDTTPAKHGKIASGMKIHPFEDLAKLGDDPCVFIITAWNFESEVRANAAVFRNNYCDIFTTCQGKS